MDSFLDSDDSWYKNRLKVIYDEIELNKGFDVFCSNEEIINISNKEKNLEIWTF